MDARPGRSCHDAIGAIFSSIGRKAKYVFDADIRGCFDNIDQTALVKKLQTYPQMRQAIEAWLKSGVMTEGEFTPTESGTPQGGVISPLLMNIALHGLEEALAGIKRTTRDKLARGPTWLQDHHQTKQRSRQTTHSSDEAAHRQTEVSPARTVDQRT